MYILYIYIYNINNVTHCPGVLKPMLVSVSVLNIHV